MIVIALVLALGLSLMLALASWRVLQVVGVTLMVLTVLFIGYGIRHSCDGVALNTFAKCSK